ncbi:PVC-type heme-binding CxxCH protein [Planctellipticum variicoloris]|uniref:PVC-type heme-binding CxxCH protein n=1 Tax=Planctellipticum variicoloris TaxID=3064265 RepID=UPI0030134F7A|nr:c-type cytochrome [Planctomycetaceae bacterium SH412]
MNRLRFAFALSCSLLTSLAPAQQIPHAQDKPPNEPRDPQTAAKMMTVPEGFTVEVVASEPDIVNPVAMAIDEQGRFWITESLEYPRREPGPGRDRVKILEDTDGDGKADKFTVFLDGLNIPSGVQVGHGGVWIANSPDILFVPDADRDGKPDGPAQVVVTGFGRTDTHELPNSLTWGPDGWLYGLNGVFNHSHVKYSPENPNYEKAGGEKHPGWPLTCAMFRIHPRTREFQVFCEGTSNPWGIAFNDEGDAFVSACVIDHLWHLVETGYYHRQGGPYPPHTWKIESIVKHKHQKAAYCGITWFDSDAYPEKYRRKLYMGNIHGGCINVDSIQRNGSTYAGSGEPDFLTANDAWFMPVVQKTGPDGCLYVLDWYDRYHCYQDANRDPAGIDRLKGRLYRVRYTGKGEPGGVSPRSLPSDYATLSDGDLIKLLSHGNGYVRETALRLLQERHDLQTALRLMELVRDESTPVGLRRMAFFAATPMFFDLPDWGGDNLWKLLNSKDRTIAAWMIRTCVEQAVPRSMRREGQWDPGTQMMVEEVILAALEDPSPEVRLQALTFLARRVTSEPPGQIYISLDEQLLEACRLCGDDPLLQRIAWQAIKAYAGRYPRILTLLLTDEKIQQSPVGKELTPRIVEWLLARPKSEINLLATVLRTLTERQQNAPAASLLNQLAGRIQSGEIKGDSLQQLKAAFEPILQPMLGVESQHPLRLEASLLALSWNDRGAVGTARSLVHNPQESPARRIAAYRALIASQDGCVAQLAREIFSKGDVESPAFLGDVFSALGRSESPEIADAVIKDFGKFPTDVQPRAIELLTQRPAWAKVLLKAIGDKKIPAAAININQARRLNDLKDPELKELLAKHWGQVREGRSLDRDKVIADMRRLIRSTPGDARKGQEVYKKICAQCHKIYGEGAEVGPEITLNGRNDYTQLLSNVFDPSLVIGAGYRSYTVATDEGRVINGLLVEDSPQRVVLKVQGGKQEIIPRDQIEDFKVSEISLMPEGIEKQYTPQELIDLFAFLTLDKPPVDPTARRLPGVTDIVPRESTNPADFASIFQEVAPGFTKVTSGEGGVALLKEFRGRPGVVRTHPVSRDQPAEVSGMFQIPADKKTTLVIEVSHDPRGDWRLVMGNSSGRLLDEMVSKETCKDGWVRYTFDMTRFAGQEIQIRMWNQANDWSYEFGYWGMVGLAVE